MQKTFDDAKVLCLNVELELKSEKENAEVRISDPDDYQSIVDAEWNIIYEKLALCVACGANVVLSKLPIGDLATQYFADRGLFCAGRVAADDLGRVCKATGAIVQTSVLDLTRAGVLGACARFEERQVGGPAAGAGADLFGGAFVERGFVFLKVPSKNVGDVRGRSRPSEYPRRGRGVVAARLHGRSTSRPRRRRDSSDGISTSRPRRFVGGLSARPTEPAQASATTCSRAARPRGPRPSCCAAGPSSSSRSPTGRSTTRS